MSPRQLTSFLARLRSAKYFEDAALAMLDEALAAARNALQSGEDAGRGQILRGMAHLRSADGYRRLVIQDETPPRGEPSTPHVPSASAWRWVVQHGGPIAIDVPIGRVRTLQ